MIGRAPLDFMRRPDCLPVESPWFGSLRGARPLPNMNSPVSNSFLTTLQRHRGGGLLADASERLAAVVAGVRATGRPGQLTVKLTVKPAQRGQSAVVLTDVVEAKAPRVEAEASFWFADDDGLLRTTDPRQKELPLRTVSGSVIDVPASPEATAANA